LHDHQVARRRASHFYVHAILVRPGFAAVVCGVVDAVDLLDLGVAGGRGQCEVGIAAEFGQHLDLVVHAAPAAVGAGVVERPVAMDEGELGLLRA